MRESTENFEKLGRIWLRGALSNNTLSELDSAADTQALPGKRLVGQTAPLATALHSQGPLTQIIQTLQPNTRAVRVVAFNKTEKSNWGVPWHQDRVIAVRERHSVAGYSNWSRKAGVWHCEPPRDILENMLFVRVHLDDCDATNGPMQIAVGSHKAGVVASADAAQVAKNYPVETTSGRRGDILVLKMLTLHRSGPAQVPSNRRVLRIDFAAIDLPYPLVWA